MKRSLAHAAHRGGDARVFRRRRLVPTRLLSLVAAVCVLVVAEIARRWKQTFGKEGLQLSPDGRITRTVGGRVLGFEALSGGERVWALLVTRLLVAGASTQAPFVWLDEPLEHLDPRLRKIVAGTLAMASSHSALRQVIVTTYEAPIAQQLMEDVPSASLIYVTSAE